jgi:hypothetical protein
MKFNVNQEMLKGIGNMGLRIGKQIVIEGTKAVILNAAATTIKTSFDEGLDGVKNLNFDDLLEGKDRKKKLKNKRKMSMKVRNDEGDEEQVDIKVVKEETQKAE